MRYILRHLNPKVTKSQLSLRKIIWEYGPWFLLDLFSQIRRHYSYWIDYWLEKANKIRFSNPKVDSTKLSLILFCFVLYIKQHIFLKTRPVSNRANTVVSSVNGPIMCDNFAFLDFLAFFAHLSHAFNRKNGDLLTRGKNRIRLHYL